MFMGPLEATKPWSTLSVEGITRFLDRVWRLFVDESGAIAVDAAEPSQETQRVLHRTIKKVGQDLESLKFNTAIAQMMCSSTRPRNKRHAREPCWSRSCWSWRPSPHTCARSCGAAWATASRSQAPLGRAFDQALVIEDSVTVAVQVNGRLRATLELPRGTAQEATRDAALADERKGGGISGRLRFSNRATQNFFPGQG